MLRWILGVSLRYRKRSEDIWCGVAVASIINKVLAAMLRWYGHVERREENQQRKTNHESRSLRKTK